MRHLAIDVIQNEHQALAAMLRSMHLLVAQAQREGRDPDFSVLRAMLFYVDEFPERLHHPKESALLFPALRQRCPELRGTLDRLDTDHGHGETAIRALAHAEPAPAPAEELREPLQALVARYLARQWQEGHVLDPVARFHLGNGARLERINWMADPSAKGLRQSLGLMVNYVYALEDVERNHEAYVNGRVVACSPAVDRLARLAEAEWPLAGEA